MTVIVQLFASLRERLGASSLERRLEEGATVGDLIRLLEDDFPRLAGAGRYALALNEQYASPLDCLHDGDEVALIPPVSGGSEVNRATVATAATRIPGERR